jgi:hypothetical protein
MDACLFCLEPTTLADNPVLSINFTKYPDVCSCRIYSHMDCWMIYYLKKGHFECPICHTKCDQRPPAREQNIVVRTENMVVQIRAPFSEVQARGPPSREALCRTTFCFVCGCISCWSFFFICLFVPVFMFFKR